MLILINIPYPWQAYRTKTFSRIHFVLKFQQFQAYNNLMVNNTFVKSDQSGTTPFNVGKIPYLGSFPVIN